MTGIAISFVYGIVLASSGMGSDEIAAALTNLPADSWIAIGGWIPGGAFSILGGYVCARTAKRAEYKPGAIVAAISAAFALLIGLSQYSASLNIVSSALTVASVMLGVWLGVYGNRRRAGTAGD